MLKSKKAILYPKIVGESVSPCKLSVRGNLELSLRTTTGKHDSVTRCFRLLSADSRGNEEPRA